MGSEKVNVFRRDPENLPKKILSCTHNCSGL